MIPCPTPTYAYNTTHMPTAQGWWRKRGQTERQMTRMSAVYHRDTASMKSHQYGRLNKTYTVAIPVDIQHGWGKPYKTPPLGEPLQAVNERGGDSSSLVTRQTALNMCTYEQN